MAEKVIAVKIDVQGTADQKKKIQGLEKTLLILNKQRARLNKQLKDNVITNDQYAKSIAKVNLGLKGTRRQLLVTRQGMLGIDGFTTRLGKSFKKLGTQLTGAFVGLFAVQKVFELFQKGIEVNKQFEKSISELSAITGKSGSELDKLSDAARRMGKETTKSAVQVAQAFTVVGSKQPELLKNADALIEVTEASILLSEAAGIEVPEAAEAVTLALNQFGDSAGGASKVVDVLAAASVEGSVLIPQLAEELSKFGGIAEKSGLSVAQAAASVEVVGKTVDQSGTKLRNILINLESSSEKFRPSVVGLSTALDNLANEGFDEIAPLAKKFGKQNAEAALSVIQNRAEVSRLTEALDVNGIAQRQAITMTDNLDGAQKRLGSAFDELFLTIGSGSEDGAITNLLDNIAEGINIFSEWATETGFFSEVFKILVNLLKLAITPFKVAFEAINELVGSFDFAGQKVSIITKALRVFNTTIKSVTKGIKLFAKNIVENFSSLGKIISAALSGDFTKIPDLVKGSFSKTGKLLKDYKEETVKSFKDAVDEKLIIADRETKKQKEELNKRIKDNKKAEDEKIKARELAAKRLSKEQENQAKREKKATENLIKKTLKLKNETLLLEIEDKREAEDKKLELAEESAKREVQALKASQVAKNEAIQAIEAKFEAQRKVLSKKREAEDAADGLKKEEKKKEENKKQLEDNAAFALQVKQQGIQIAGETAMLLTDIAQQKADREKDIELANLNAQLENGVINQAQFEAEKLKIEKDAFKKKKKLELANVAIALATEIANIQAAAAANPLNAVTFGSAGLSQAAVLTGIAIAKSAVQAGAIASQSFAQGGYTGNGSGIADETGFKQAGIVHEGEYVVPKHVLGTSEGSSLVSALENMRTNKPMPNLNIGYANGGLVGSGNIDLQGLRQEVVAAVSDSIGVIQVTNVATDTTSQAIKVNNIEQEASFG